MPDPTRPPQDPPRVPEPQDEADPATQGEAATPAPGPALPVEAPDETAFGELKQSRLNRWAVRGA